MDGWIKIHRKIEENPIVCKDNDYFRVWHHILYNAVHKEVFVMFDNKKIKLTPGQYLTNRKKIAKKCKVSESKVERILKTFEIEQQIEQQTCSKNCIITIKKWELYQQSGQQNEQQVNNKWTTSEQQMNTKQECNNVINIEEEYNTRACAREEVEYDWLNEE